MVIFGLYRNFEAQWSLEYSMFYGSQFNYWGSLFVSFGFICAIMLLAKSNRLEWFRNRMAAIGQTALSNYILQSILCTFIFYGFGLGFFGQIDRSGQVLIMAGVWLIQILWSRPWLDKFRFGPLEWAWRSLTYMKVQQFRQ